MSDFDKEAERERLREKYERDEEKRKVTERMSELLLKGATMTNAHCQDCGDPIFRYDGQEFCATCQKTVSRATDGDDDNTDANGDQADADGEREEIEVASPDETTVRFGDGPEGPDTTAANSTEADAPPQPDRDPQHAERAGQPDGRTPDRNHDDRRQPTGPPADVARGDFGEAADSLTRSVTTLARQAEATDDLGRKRDLFVAVREAAAALSAVRDAGR